MDPSRRLLARRGLGELVLIALIGLAVLAGFLPLSVGVGATFLLVLVWTIRVGGDRLIARHERLHLELREPMPEGQESNLIPVDRSAFYIVVISPLMLIAISVGLLSAGVHFDVVPRMLALVSTAFLAGVTVVSLAMLWSIRRQASRERTDESVPE